MLKRKASNSSLDDEDSNDEEYVPIPIQFFFWNQTSLFIKQKFGNLTEAHALVRLIYFFKLKLIKIFNFFLN